MAKCVECSKRKAKRLCSVRDGWICSQCCGTLREADTCGDCTFYKPPARDYDSLPRCSTADMEASDRLLQIAYPIEGGLCALDRSLDFGLNDAQAIEIIELLLDLYAFDDSLESLADRIQPLGCESLLKRIQRELIAFPREDIAKVLGAVRFVARRRARHGRDHLDHLQAFIRPQPPQR